MGFFRTIAAASALSLAAVLTLWGQGTADASGTAYAALGDSYSAGVGAGRYAVESGICERSANAYPVLWAAVGKPSSFSFTACDGATTTDVINGQLGVLGRPTGLVSVTVGGDDAGFAEVMAVCALGGESSCLRRLSRAGRYVDSTLPGRLDRVYSAIRAKAPAARVVVLGYPHFYRPKGSCRMGLAEAERSAVNNGIDRLDAVIAEHAARHGFVFADVRRAFTGHEICSDSPWLHSVTLPVGDSYHPTAAGQSGGYLPVFTAAARRHRRPPSVNRR